MFPKPESRKKVKARVLRAERLLKKFVRQKVFDRDTDCRFPRAARASCPCEGPHEWAHINDWRRSRTGGLPAHERHSTVGSIRLCRRHHQILDGQDRHPTGLPLSIVPTIVSLGANAILVWFLGEEILGES